MKEETPITPAQRKALIELLGEYGDVCRRAKKKYEETRNALEESLILAIAKEKGADKLLLQCRSLKQQTKAVEDKIDQLGFDVTSDGGFEFNYNAPDSWKERVEGELDSAFGSKKQLLDSLFETARVKLWLVPTVAEAEQIVEPLLNFEVKSSK